MRLNKLLVYLGLVALLCSLAWAADVGDDDEDDVEVDSENEPEDKVRRKRSIPFAFLRDVHAKLSSIVFV